VRAAVVRAPWGPIRPKIVPSCASRETSSSATIPPNRSEAFWSERRPISVARTLRIPAASVEVLLPEVLHRRLPRRGGADRVVRRVGHGAHDEAALGVDVEDVDAGGRLLEGAEERASAGERAAENRAVDGAV